MDVSIPNSPKRGGDAIVGCIACNQHYCNTDTPDKSLYMVLAMSFLLFCVGFLPLLPVG